MRALVIAWILALCLAAGPAGARMLSGEVTIREGIVLPADAPLVFQVRDAAGGVVATAEVPLDGSQTRVAFSLDTSQAAATLRAMITFPG
jgi:uncharacterized lipoprotein YbaY